MDDEHEWGLCEPAAAVVGSAAFWVTVAAVAGMQALTTVSGPPGVDALQAEA